MQRKCVYCGKAFTVPENLPNMTYCSEKCIMKNYRRRRRARGGSRSSAAVKVPQPYRNTVREMTIDEVLRWANRHYNKTGEWLSYGRAVARLEYAEKT